MTLRWPWSHHDDEIERSRREAEQALAETRQLRGEVAETSARLRDHLLHNHIADRVTRAMGGR